MSPRTLTMPPSSTPASWTLVMPSSLTEGGEAVVICPDSSWTTSSVRHWPSVCTIPPTVLRKVPANFSPATKTAIAEPVGVATGKIALQYQRMHHEDAAS